MRDQIADKTFRVPKARVPKARILLTSVVPIILLFLSAVQSAFVARCSEYGQALLGQSYRSFITNNYPECLAACQAEKECISLNFDLHSLVCDLNKHVKGDWPAIGVKKPNSIYFQTRMGCSKISALGLGSGEIPDSSFTASSFFKAGWEPWRGRLNHVDRAACWGPKQNRLGEYLQIDLGRGKYLVKIATQGRGNADYWTKAYKVSHSEDGVQWTEYSENGQVKVGRC